MESITILNPSMEAHLTGCADIEKALRRHEFDQATAYAGDDVIAATIAADTALAGYFGEKPYTDYALTNGCWTVAACSRKPCLERMFAGYQHDKRGRWAIIDTYEAALKRNEWVDHDF